ncbi:ribosome maturation factor RimM [Skermanella rosea]|uniref:ribosome maturation factor RimM n=1 Tax=Skermanella rosea TaxID=1817965 RepID=UPI001931C670|nr:ribosome maturation factor RimM [Skermanella rosea]UEM02086.1 ribosome maturation factor RimM [Skermanella rosea]
MAPRSAGKPDATGARVCVGQIVGVHGVRGLVKLKSFTGDPAAIADYNPLTDHTGTRRFTVELQSAMKDYWLARVQGVADRTAAEALRGVLLHVERDRLPPPEDEDEFYHADLIGLPVLRPDGERIGTVVALHDFGGGDMLEVALPDRRTAMVPFTRAIVPVVDVAGGRIVADPPEDLLAPPGAPDRGEDEDDGRADGAGGREGA